jgi:hypothetical protein
VADVTIVSLTVVSDDAAVLQGRAGAAVGLGHAVYYDAPNGGVLKPADVGDAGRARMVGLSLTPVGDGQVVEYVFRGEVDLGGSVLTQGQTYVLSANAGRVCPVSDLAAGQQVTYAGWAKTDRVLRLMVTPTGVTRG